MDSAAIIGVSDQVRIKRKFKEKNAKGFYYAHTEVSIPTKTCTVKNVVAISTKYGGNSHNPHIHHGGEYISGYYHHFIEDLHHKIVHHGGKHYHLPTIYSASYNHFSPLRRILQSANQILNR